MLWNWKSQQMNYLNAQSHKFQIKWWYYCTKTFLRPLCQLMCSGASLQFIFPASNAVLACNRVTNCSTQWNYLCMYHNVVLIVVVINLYFQWWNTTCVMFFNHNKDGILLLLPWLFVENHWCSEIKSHLCIDYFMHIYAMTWKILSLY